MSIAKTQRPGRPRSALSPLEAIPDRPEEPPCVLGRAPGADFGVIRAATDRPEPDPVRREAVVLDIALVGGIALIGPDQPHGGPVDRERDGPTGQPDRRERRGPGLVRALVETRVLDTSLGEHALHPADVCALGEPEPARTSEPSQVGSHPGVDLEPAARRRRELGEDRVSGGGRHQLDPPLRVGGLEGAQGISAEPLQALDHTGIVPCLRSRRGPELLRPLRRVPLGGLDAMPAEEVEHPLPHPVGLELVGEHGGDGHGQALRHLEHREVGPRERLEQPLLAERIGPEPLHVGHVGVQDDREVAGCPVGHLTPCYGLLLGFASEHPRRSRRNRAPGPAPRPGAGSRAR